MTQTPYIANIRGFFCVVWAASYNGPFERDRSITPHAGGWHEDVRDVQMACKGNA
jgi:hypothetical protein